MILDFVHWYVIYKMNKNFNYFCRKTSMSQTWLRNWSHLLHKLLPGFVKEKVRFQGLFLFLSDSRIFTTQWVTTTKLFLAHPAENRHYGKTKMNQRSSRSHTIFRMVRDWKLQEILSTQIVFQSPGSLLDPWKQREEWPSDGWERWRSHHRVPPGEREASPSLLTFCPLALFSNNFAFIPL